MDSILVISETSIFCCGVNMADKYFGAIYKMFQASQAKAGASRML